MLAAEEVGTEVLTGEYLSQWLRHSKGRLRSKTHEGYEGLIRLYAAPALGGIVLARLHPLHLQECYASLLERGLAGGTVLNLHLVLAQALSQAVRWGLIDAEGPSADGAGRGSRRPLTGYLTRSLQRSRRVDAARDGPERTAWAQPPLQGGEMLREA